MNVFNVDVRIYGTAYIKAETVEEASAKLAQAIKDGAWLEMDGGGSDSLPINGEALDSDSLPEVSLSPAMTVVGPDEGDEPEEA